MASEYNSRCKQCPMGFPKKGNLRRHVENVHSEGCKQMRCNVCRMIWNNAYNLDRHIKTRHTVRPISVAGTSATVETVNVVGSPGDDVESSSDSSVTIDPLSPSSSIVYGSADEQISAMLHVIQPMEVKVILARNELLSDHNGLAILEYFWTCTITLYHFFRQGFHLNFRPTLI